MYGLPRGLLRRSIEIIELFALAEPTAHKGRLLCAVWPNDIKHLAGPATIVQAHGNAARHHAWRALDANVNDINGLAETEGRNWVRYKALGPRGQRAVW